MIILSCKIAAIKCMLYWYCSSWARCSCQLHSDIANVWVRRQGEHMKRGSVSTVHILLLHSNTVAEWTAYSWASTENRLELRLGRGPELTESQWNRKKKCYRPIMEKLFLTTFSISYPSVTNLLQRGYWTPSFRISSWQNSLQAILTMLSVKGVLQFIDTYFTFIHFITVGYLHDTLIWFLPSWGQHFPCKLNLHTSCRLPHVFHWFATSVQQREKVSKMLSSLPHNASQVNFPFHRGFHRRACAFQTAIK